MAVATGRDFLVAQPVGLWAAVCLVRWAVNVVLEVEALEEYLAAAKVKAMSVAVTVQVSGGEEEMEGVVTEVQAGVIVVVKKVAACLDSALLEEMVQLVEVHVVMGVG